MKMTKEAEKALKASIKHWEIDVLGEGMAPSGRNCALCNLFGGVDCEDDEGEKCPIARHTSAVGCSYTPYNDYIRVYDYDSNTPEMKKHAKAMIKFMERLLPKEGE